MKRGEVLRELLREKWVTLVKKGMTEKSFRVDGKLVKVCDLFFILDE